MRACQHAKNNNNNIYILKNYEMYQKKSNQLVVTLRLTKIVVV